MKINSKTLQTDRLVLIPVEEGHKYLIHKILKNKELRDSIRFPVLDDPKEYDEWWENRNCMDDRGDLMQWTTFLKSDNSFCGLMTLKEISTANMRAEIGYSFLPKVWRQGFGYEAVKTVHDFAFYDLKLHSLFAQILPFNEGSKKIVKRLGFIKEAHFRDIYFYEDQFYDLLQFSKVGSTD